jgi:hypothetical protein
MALVSDCRDAPVSVFVSVTTACGMTAAWESVTVPRNEAVA